MTSVQHDLLNQQMNTCSSRTQTIAPVIPQQVPVRPRCGDHANVCRLFTAVVWSGFVLFGWQSQGVADENASKKHVEMDLVGWVVVVDQQVLDKPNQPEGRACLDALRDHLRRVTYILPPDRVADLKKVRIRMDWKHKLKTMQYHPSKGWLLKNGYDPGMAKHVHIPIAKALLARDQWAKHPYVVLHELAHAYHDQILGFDNPRIEQAFETMKASGTYDKVLAHSGRRTKHYALSNPMEYFAESSEAYLGVNDFFPFVRAELREHDPRMFDIMKDIWGEI